VLFVVLQARRRIWPEVLPVLGFVGCGVAYAVGNQTGVFLANAAALVLVACFGMLVRRANPK